MTSLILTSLQLLPFATARTMSRSVTMPVSVPFSITRSAPIRHSAICFDASRSDWSLMTLKHSMPLIPSSSFTFMSCLSSHEDRCGLLRCLPPAVPREHHCRGTVEEMRELRVRRIGKERPHEHQMEVVDEIPDLHVGQAKHPGKDARCAHAGDDGQEDPVEVGAESRFAGLAHAVQQD